MTNLGMLFIFKYTDMVLKTVNQISHSDFPMANLALPIGISFFTFQALSYVIDVYRKEARAEKNVLHVMLYISFFPQLIAGPIVKYHDIQEQIRKRKADPQEIAEGMRRFIVGLSKKVLISNTMAYAADTLFALQASQLNILSAWTAAIAYLFQIYFDFSGYSDMAIGLGHMFGFGFRENFDYPYISGSIKEFWRRWHISLSTWFKEYLYIPLGGNRRGRVRTCVNKLIVFFSTGLWHGANWTFVVWGLWHGSVYAFGRSDSCEKASESIAACVCASGRVYRIRYVPCRYICTGNDDDRENVYRLGVWGFTNVGGIVCTDADFFSQRACVR